VPDARRLLGDLGEATAARALERHGVRIVARNARTRFGRDRRGLVFVEVKTRRRGSFVSAIEAVDGRKVARLRGLALAWAAQHATRERMRLVVAAVTVDRGGCTVDLVEVGEG
jgi:putative endonuclease